MIYCENLPLVKVNIVELQTGRVNILERKATVDDASCKLE